MVPSRTVVSDREPLRPAPSPRQAYRSGLTVSRARPREACDVTDGSNGAGPLDGLRLIDFGQYLAGPLGPMILADLGMDVIKVEPVTGDGMRMAGKPFFGCQRGKRDVALNVVKPDIVYCNTYAYGFEGPLSHFGGLDPLYQAATGLEYEAGATQHRNDPLYYRFGMCDAANAMLSVVGVLAALLHRTRTGEGQELWTSLLDGGAVFASDAMVKPDGTPVARPRLDQQTNGIDPAYRLYETQDGWLQVAAMKPEQWDALCTTLGVDPSLDRSTAGAQLELRFRTRTAVSWSYNLDDVGVPNEVAIDPKGGDLMLFDADNDRLGLVVDYEHPIMGAMRQFGNTIDFSDTPFRPHRPPPRIGEDTEAILAWLGVDEARRTVLKGQGVVTWPDESYAAA